MFVEGNLAIHLVYGDTRLYILVRRNTAVVIVTLNVYSYTHLKDIF